MDRKVLVIEDATDTLTSLLDLIESQGFQAIGAKNGLIGLQLANEQLPDLIISDINMPEMNGYEVLEALRQNTKTARIPFIFLSGEESNASRRLGLELGAADYLTKPVINKQLMDAIAVQLQKQCISH
ncbi:response regulator [Funiculus sociatus GB2-A5]|uniref:Response regulator n=1 Tax=Funiculus sociatus GB2-A5 TaxID=2933946 RepID=A0ABV0JWL6_9CYAN|nr:MULTISPECIES: response regulator [unclassified Trichocoleus]MBD1905100.1 response regulator [Trichocoleus sp. FACHB-832]MBD2062634.1 response regulator [Trichocoleus sp. FACHB-6]